MSAGLLEPGDIWNLAPAAKRISDDIAARITGNTLAIEVSDAPGGYRGIYLDADGTGMSLRGTKGQWETVRNGYWMFRPDSRALYWFDAPSRSPVQFYTSNREFTLQMVDGKLIAKGNGPDFPVRVIKGRPVLPVAR